MLDATPPPWLVLDEVCPPDLRDQATRLTAQVVELTAEVRDLARDAEGVLGEMSRRLPADPADGVVSAYEVFGDYTGQAALRAAFAELADLAEEVLR